MQLVLGNLLISHAPLAAIIGNAAHWDEIPQGVALPNVLMFDVSSRTDYTYQGANGLRQARIQFDCRGSSRAQARNVLAALDDRLIEYRGHFDGFRFDGFFRQSDRSRSEKTDAERVFTCSVDYLIWWAKAA